MTHLTYYVFIDKLFEEKKKDIRFHDFIIIEIFYDQSIIHIFFQLLGPNKFSRFYHKNDLELYFIFL